MNFSFDGLRRQLFIGADRAEVRNNPFRMRLVCGKRSSGLVCPELVCEELAWGELDCGVLGCAACGMSGSAAWLSPESENCWANPSVGSANRHTPKTRAMVAEEMTGVRTSVPNNFRNLDTPFRRQDSLGERELWIIYLV